MTPHIRICFPCPTPKAGRFWGDFYFGRSLSRAFEARGIDYSMAFQVKRGFSRKQRQPSVFRKRVAAIDLVIRGKVPYPIHPNRPHFIWLISHSAKLTEEEIHGAQHIFSASRPTADALIAAGVSASYLPQCTDTQVFFPSKPNPQLATTALFVGNRRPRAPRPSVRLAMSAGVDLAVWGDGWNGLLPEGVWRGTEIANSNLGAHYRAAGFVLNDHHRDMRRTGSISNRVYDVLATGRPILTERMSGLPEDLMDGIVTYTPKTFSDDVKAAQHLPQSTLEDVARRVAGQHGFQHRADDMLQIIR